MFPPLGFEYAIKEAEFLSEDNLNPLKPERATRSKIQSNPECERGEFCWLACQNDFSVISCCLGKSLDYDKNNRVTQQNLSPINRSKP